MVLDASALLAYLQGERGADAVAEALAGGAAVIGAVNWSEALSKLAERGQDPDAIAERLEAEGLIGGVLSVMPLMAKDAPLIARLRPPTRAAGLSLGDRACLALGITLGLPVITAERLWADLDLPISVEVIR